MMPIPFNPTDDNKNTYPIDSAHPAEWARLSLQDDLLTEAMGGELVGLPDVSRMQSVLDLACGSGGWVLRTASKYPHLHVTGIDISRHMIENAEAVAESMGIASRVHFHVADITLPLPFAEASFDLLNSRFISTFLTQRSWGQLLTECLRVLRPEGILRLTEPEIGLTNGPALERLNKIMVKAFVDRGCGDSPVARHMGVITMLPSLLRTHGFQDVRIAAHALDYGYGTPGNGPIHQNMVIGYKLMQDAFVQSGRVTEEDFLTLYQQADVEMQQAWFRGLWLFLSTWGKKGEE